MNIVIDEENNNFGATDVEIKDKGKNFDSITVLHFVFRGLVV